MRVLEPCAAVERQEALPGERELDDQHTPRLAGGTVRHAFLHMVDARLRQQRHVESRRLLGLAVEPQAWCNLRHGRIP